jgi:protein arginine kinase activator
MATIHVTDTENGEKRHTSLCEDCAQEEGITGKKHATPQELLNALMSQQQAAQVEAAKLVCKECKITYAEFRQTGLLGCPACYASFEQQLVPLLERAHDGIVEHYGKVPRKAGGSPARSVQSDLIRLRRELKAAIEQEDYENAARLRDHIKDLEQS